MLSFFGDVHLEFYCNAWTLCLMCIVTLFYSNPMLIRHDKTSAFRVNGHGYMHQLIQFVFIVFCNLNFSLPSNWQIQIFKFNSLPSNY